MRDILVTLIVLVALPYVLRRPSVGVLLLSWLGYMNPHRLGWGFAYNLPFAQVAAITTIISLFISKEKKSFPVTPITVTLILFILWMGVTTMFAVIPEDATAQYIKVIKIQMIVFMTLLVMGSKERLNQLVWVIVVSIGFFGVKGGIFTILTGGSYRVWGPPGSFMEGNNELALALLMVVPLMNYLRTIVDNKYIKMLLIASILLCSLAIVGSQSRGALVAGVVMLLFFWLKSNKKLVTGVALVVVAATLFAFMPDSWHQRMDTIETYEEDASAMGRINAWTMAFNMAKDKVTGGGFDHWSPLTFQLYAPNPDDVHDAHSIYFEVLGEHGFFGLFLFLLIGGLALNNARWIYKKTLGDEEYVWLNNLSRMVYVSLIAYATGGAFLGMAYFDLFYHLVVIVILGRVIIENKMAGKREVPD